MTWTDDELETLKGLFDEHTKEIVGSRATSSSYWTPKRVTTWAGAIAVVGSMVFGAITTTWDWWRVQVFGGDILEQVEEVQAATLENAQQIRNNASYIAAESTLVAEIEKDRLDNALFRIDQRFTNCQTAQRRHYQNVQNPPNSFGRDCEQERVIDSLRAFATFSN